MNGVTRTPAPNSTYPKVAVQWLNQAMCFYQSFCLVDSEVLRNRHLRVAAKRCGKIRSAPFATTVRRITSASCARRFADFAQQADLLNPKNCHVLKKVYTFYINTKIRLQFKYNPKIDLQSPFFCNNFSIYNLPF